MITIKFGQYSVDARGHAGSAPYGSDLVCAAVSTLLYALIQGLDCLEGVDVTVWDLQAGNGHVEATGVPPEGMGMFMMAKAALTHLASQFPDSLQIASK